LSGLRIALCVDALSPQPGGIGRYTWELAKGLAGRDDLDQLSFFGRGRLIDEPRHLIEGREFPRRRKLLRRIDAWRMKRTLRSSVVHGPNYFLPAAVESGVITVHDLSVFKFPETHPSARLRAFEQLFKSSLDRSAHIITDTETIRQELVATFSVRPETVTAIPLGVDPRFKPTDGSPSEALTSWGLSLGGYGLCVSTLEPRKKIRELLLAWERLPAEIRNRFPLALAGGSGWENDDLHAEIERAVGDGWLRPLGFVDDERLPELYAGAALFIYPSVYEGFGLPPIEAMASGVPVIVANRSCLPEVCGEAARYVDPDDLGAFASTIEASLRDAAWRTEAIAQGVERAGQFTWDRCVERTIGVYRKVINSV
jgi:glycosyltransferase involved in cell wall biosynthesis